MLFASKGKGNGSGMSTAWETSGASPADDCYGMQILSIRSSREK